MRRFLVGGLCLAIQAGAFHAPLVHAHLDNHNAGHHDGPAIHAHFGGHMHGPAKAGPHEPEYGPHEPEYGPHEPEYVGSGFSRTLDHPVVTLGDDPEEATRLQIFVAVDAAAIAAPAPPPARFMLAPVYVSVMHRRPDVIRSHGPPSSRSTPPRAPPSLSV